MYIVKHDVTYEYACMLLAWTQNENSSRLVSIAWRTTLTGFSSPPTHTSCKLWLLGEIPGLPFSEGLLWERVKDNFEVGSWVWWTGGLFEVTTNVRSLPSLGDGIFVQTHFEWTLTWLLSWKLDSRKKPLPRSVMRSIAMLEWSPC